MNLESLKQSNTFRVLFIGFLVLLLLIPTSMVKSVIKERGHLYRKANHEITQSWGKEQLLAGPVLTVTRKDGFSEQSGWSYGSRHRHLRPESLTVDAHIDTQIRYRGIYKVPVHTTQLHISGHFNLDEMQANFKQGDEHGQYEGMIQIPLQTSRAIKEPLRFSWEGEEIKLELKRHYTEKEGIVFEGRLPLKSLEFNKDYAFELDIKLAGSSAFSFISSACESNIQVRSNWHSPSFFGTYLPSQHTITEQGFNADWQISDLLSDIGTHHIKSVSFDWFNQQPRFGVKLIETVDTYQVVTRASKYAILFIGLTFMVYFFTELFGKVRVHPIQYLFVGIANCIFYLLLLSLAEYIQFNLAYVISSLAYVISSLASVLLMTLYSVSVLKSRAKAIIVFAVTSALYTYLFVTLRSEDFALLIGSMGLFIILSTAMYLTRNIDWHESGKEVV